MKPDASARFGWPEPYDFVETTRLLRTGGNDPGFRREPDGFWRALRTEAGPATVRVVAIHGLAIEADAWGPGAEPALRDLPRCLGLNEPPWRLPAHPATDRLLRRHPGVRLTDTDNVYEALVNIVLQQLVTWNEAVFVWRRLLESYGDVAPGPVDLRVLPEPTTLRRVGTDRLVALGMSHRRAVTLQEVAFAASRLRRAADLPTDEALRLLMTVRGIGPWTAAMAMGLRLGRPEPMVAGDLHLPNTIAWALAGEARADDARMSALLAPFSGQAFRVVRLLFAARVAAPRRGPRRELRFGR